MGTIAEKYGLSFEKIAALSLDAFERHIPLAEYRQYFRTFPGEHYRVLAYLSQRTDGMLLFDVGTLYGYSALAMATNSRNTVVSYNIKEQRLLAHAEELPNIEFCVGDVLGDERLARADMILLDTAHEGPFEHLFLDQLLKRQFQGLLILDDIHLNPMMEEFWKGVPCAKEDVTPLAHCSGTGLVLCSEPPWRTSSD